VGDLQHFPIVMNTNSGNPMIVKSVSVWQRSSAGNLQQ
jgi:hypothetical protein